MPVKIDTNKFVEHLNSKWQGGIMCPVCKENNWTVHDTLSEQRDFYFARYVMGGPVVPLATITCNNCGYTMQFNAIKAGLIDPETIQGKEEKDSGK